MLNCKYCRAEKIVMNGEQIRVWKVVIVYLRHCSNNLTERLRITIEYPARIIGGFELATP
jgi:hypothetical protein